MRRRTDIRLSLALWDQCAGAERPRASRRRASAEESVGTTARHVDALDRSAETWTSGCRGRSVVTVRTGLENSHREFASDESWCRHLRERDVGTVHGVKKMKTCFGDRPVPAERLVQVPLRIKSKCTIRRGYDATVKRTPKDGPDGRQSWSIRILAGRVVVGRLTRGHVE